MTTHTEQHSVQLTNASGLHARPAIEFMKTAKGFVADIEFSGDDGASWVNAKSIVKVMAAKVPSGTELLIRATGDDAQQAVSALVTLVRHEFDRDKKNDSGSD